MKTAAAILVITALALPASATIVYTPSFNELYEESVLVVSGTIEQGSVLPDDCGVAYTVRTDRSFKGSTKRGARVTFQGYGAMQVGATYLLFLGKTGEEYAPLISTNSDDMSVRARYLKKCKGVRPAHTVNLMGDGALKIVDTYAMEDAVIFGILDFTPPDGVTTRELKPGDRYDNDRKGNAMAHDELVNYLETLAADD